jgi:hypothetical protein
VDFWKQTLFCDSKDFKEYLWKNQNFINKYPVLSKEKDLEGFKIMEVYLELCRNNIIFRIKEKENLYKQNNSTVFISFSENCQVALREIRKNSPYAAFDKNC